MLRNVYRILFQLQKKNHFLKKIARNQYTTTQNKSLVISEGCHDNFEPNKIFKSLGCTGMMDLNGDLEFRWHRNGGLSAQCPVVD